MSDQKTIWTNAKFSDDAKRLLDTDLTPFRLIESTTLSRSNLVSGTADPLLAEATIAFGQPDPQQVIDSPNVKWVHLTSAGYTRYDTPAFRDAIKARQGILTNSSTVFSEPCAEHALAMILALARQLPQAIDDQLRDRTWPIHPLRSQSRLLSGQTILIYGYGSIARRLLEMLRPLGMRITGVRRRPAGDEGIPIVTAEEADTLLPTTDHVMNILPQSPQTERFFDARRISLLSPAALFYNIGRGATVDQDALLAALSNQKIAGAYLDVTTPEPLPPDHPLWRAPHCWITPHTAGGHANEMPRIVIHFRENLRRYASGEKLVDVVF